MRLQRRWLSFVLLAMFCTTGVVPGAWAQDDEALAYYRQAKINWRQAEGQSLTIGLNKHPFTESLLPLIPEFRKLTGISVEYLTRIEQGRDRNPGMSPSTETSPRRPDRVMSGST